MAVAARFRAYGSAESDRYGGEEKVPRQKYLFVVLVALFGLTASAAWATFGWQTRPMLGDTASSVTGDMVIVTGPQPLDPLGNPYYDLDGNVVLGPTIPHYSIPGDPLFGIGWPSKTWFWFDPSTWSSGYGTYYDPTTRVYSSAGMYLNLNHTYDIVYTWSFLGVPPYDVPLTSDDVPGDPGFRMSSVYLYDLWAEDAGPWKYTEKWSDQATGEYVQFARAFSVQQGSNVLLLTVPTESLFVKSGETVQVFVNQMKLETPAAGYQAFAAFDGKLAFVSGTYTSAPYGWPIVTPIGASGGVVTLAAGIYPPQTPSTDEARLAELTFTAGDEGTTQITFAEVDGVASRFTDDQGNEITTSTVNGPVIVIDNTVPTITCPADIGQTADAGLCSAVVAITPATASDGGSGVESVTAGRSDALDLTAPYPVGATVITWTASDQSGNTASCAQTVTVTDDEAPVLPALSNISVGTDAGVCTAVVSWADIVATDNCDGNVTATCDPVSGSTFAKGDTTVNVSVTDAAGNTSTGSFTVTVTDDEDPTITCPADITVPCPPNADEATVDPGTATATDNCDSTPTIAGTRSDSLPLTDPYPIGTTTITWRATDDAGNYAECPQTITVLAVCQAEITIELEGVVATTIDRCIELSFGGTGGSVAPYTTSVIVSFTDKVGVASLSTVPAGVNWTCIAAKDKLHTLCSKVALGVSGGKYVASLTGADKLIGGDLTNDDLVDILDFGAFAGQYGQTKTAANCSYTGRHADISGNALVGTEDFSYIQTHFLNRGDGLCGNATSVASVAGRTSVTVAELARIIGRQQARKADVNSDGVVNTTDVKLFLQSAGRLRR